MDAKASASDKYAAIAKRHRAILSKKEREIIALQKTVEQVTYELANVDAIIAKHQERRQDIAKRLEEAEISLQSGLAALD